MQTWKSKGPGSEVVDHNGFLEILHKDLHLDGFLIVHLVEGLALR
jgi:hypothetical protein